MSKIIKVLCVGDVVDTAGCEFLTNRLSAYKRENSIDVCIVNGENSARGNGITPKSCEQLFIAGADFVTGGNHSLKRREFYDFLDSREDVIRPFNYDNAPGRGFGIIDKGAYRIGVVNLVGRVWLDGFSNPFEKAEEAVEILKKEVNMIFVDFHAESTSEKKAMGYFLDGKVSAVYGTHTHVQTTDCTVLKGGTGYITDLGMTGPEESVLGVKKEIIIEKFSKGFAPMFETGEGASFMQGCIFTVDRASGKTLFAEAVTLR